MSADKPRRIGRGLEALIPGAKPASPAPGSDLQRIAMSRVRANPFQPRREFAQAELAELEASLRASGLLQPITVRRRGDAYELIAGERRFRAATNIGWTEISAIVRDFDDRTMLVLALVENLQRANLNAIEEARGYRRLIDEFQLTQQQVADSVGKDRTTITNLLRILALPAQVQELVEKSLLSTGHARALLGLPSTVGTEEVAAQAVDQAWTVRELERRVRELSGRPADGSGNKQRVERESATPSVRSNDPAARRIEDELRRYFQTDVHLRFSAEAKGTIELCFYSTDDLERIVDLIPGSKKPDFQ